MCRYTTNSNFNKRMYLLISESVIYFFGLKGGGGNNELYGYASNDIFTVNQVDI